MRLLPRPTHEMTELFFIIARGRYHTLLMHIIVRSTFIPVVFKGNTSEKEEKAPKLGALYNIYNMTNFYPGDGYTTMICFE